MNEPQNCPKCQSSNIYQDGNTWVCPECGHEWMPSDERVELDPADSAGAEGETQVKDANGISLKDGDSVIVLKDLKIKGASGVVKGGTKVRNIRLFDAGDGHDITCKIDGLGSINLKSEYVRKV
jgi:protein PhnA